MPELRRVFAERLAYVLLGHVRLDDDEDLETVAEALEAAFATEIHKALIKGNWTCPGAAPMSRIDDEVFEQMQERIIALAAQLEPEGYRHMTPQERADGAETMTQDLLQLAEMHGCVAAAWSLSFLAQALVAIKAREQTALHLARRVRLLRRAAWWFSENPVGTPVPDWIDTALASQPVPEETDAALLDMVFERPELLDKLRKRLEHPEIVDS